MVIICVNVRYITFRIAFRSIVDATPNRELKLTNHLPAAKELYVYLFIFHEKTIDSKPNSHDILAKEV